MPEINGMTRAAHALRYWESRQQVVANNLANVDTAGFKGERVFAEVFGDALPVANSATDLTNGALKQTDAPLDLALGGDGFFVVETAQGEQLTRGGSFRLDDGGRIVDANGNPLLGEAGEIVVPDGGEVAINSAGDIHVDGQEVGRLRVEAVPQGEPLEHAGGNLFIAAGRQPIAEDARDVRQGYVEDSNVSSVGSLVDMISVQRNYTSVQRTIVTLDEIRQKITNDIGRVS